MHERSLARALVRQVEAVAVANHGPRVRCVRVSVGEFSGVDADLLESAWRESSDGTSLQGVPLALARVQVEGRCGQCREEFEIVGFRFVCPRCGSRSVDVVRGEELMLESVTLEAPDS